jgi:hypothetical protein
MRGTSQAAALVSGVVALIRAVRPDWEPWKIKQRIVSTADLLADEPDEPHVLGGVLNAHAATTDLNTTAFRPSIGQPCTALVTRASGDIRITPGSSAERKRDIEWRDVRRLKLTRDRQSIILMYTRYPDRDNVDPLVNEPAMALPRLIREVVPLARLTLPTLELAPANSCGVANVDVRTATDIINGF